MRKSPFKSVVHPAAVGLLMAVAMLVLSVCTIVLVPPVVVPVVVTATMTVRMLRQGFWGRSGFRLGRLSRFNPLRHEADSEHCCAEQHRAEGVFTVTIAHTRAKAAKSACEFNDQRRRHQSIKTSRRRERTNNNNNKEFQPECGAGFFRVVPLLA